MFKIRQALVSDIDQITNLFYDTIQHINTRDYSQKEADIWSSGRNDKEKWKQKIEDQYFIVALFETKIVGFASITEMGYLDLIFTHKDFQQKGIGKEMLKKLEQKAQEQNNELIYAEVSLTAKKFFQSKGYKIEKQQLKIFRDTEFINFVMFKQTNIPKEEQSSSR